jgi:chemotaxis protein MotB
MINPIDIRSRASHQRWLISYADFLTLLFAAFVVLFVSERAEKGTARKVSESVMAALGQREMPAPVPARSVPQNPAKTSAALLTRELREEIEKQHLEVRLESRGLVISLRQAAFFQSGHAELDPASYPMVDKIARILGDVPNLVRLEGHTDSVRIRNSRFKSNWELSAARSIAMMEALAARGGIPRNRLSIAGYAETVPVGANDDAEGRARNRRVDVVILNDLRPR